MPMPDRLRCINLLFNLMNLQSLRMCFIELSIYSYSTAAFYAVVFAFFDFISSVLRAFSVFSISNGVD